jgi:hypothetical protein
LSDCILTAWADKWRKLKKGNNPYFTRKIKL